MKWWFGLIRILEKVFDMYVPNKFSGRVVEIEGGECTVGYEAESSFEYVSLIRGEGMVG